MPAEAPPPLLFATPARPELVERGRTLLASDGIADVERERAAAGAVADAYLDSVVDGLVRVFAQKGPGMAAATASLLDGLASAVGSGARTVLGRGLARADASELLALRAFVRRRVRPTPGGPHPGLVVFPLEQLSPGDVDHLVRAGHEQRLPDERPALAAAMTAVIDGAIRHHFEEPVALMHPGFLLRQALGVAVATIRAAAHAVLRRGIHHEGEPQLRALVHFLQRGTSRAAAGRGEA